jgi:hypothetical protein
MIRHLFHSWRSLRPREALAFVTAALLFGVVDLTSLLEVQVGDQLPQVLARHLLVPLVSCGVLLLCWLPAARSSPIHPRRRRRLVLATLLGSALTVVIVYPLIAALPWPSICDLYAAAHGKPKCMNFRVTALIGDMLWVFMPALMIVGVLEFRALRRRQDQAVQDLLREHSQLRRHALASRLAALQAQVDPKLLFDALVAIEQAYDRRDPAASGRLERLIRHLRVALPRLREPGTTTLDGEAELIASYLALLRDLNGTPSQSTATWDSAAPAACRPCCCCRWCSARCGWAGRHAAGCTPARRCGWVSTRPACAPRMRSWRRCASAWPCWMPSWPATAPTGAPSSRWS